MGATLRHNMSSTASHAAAPVSNTSASDTYPAMVFVPFMVFKNGCLLQELKVGILRKSTVAASGKRCVIVYAMNGEMQMQI